MSQPMAQSIGLVVLRITLGVFMVWFGFDRASWLLNAAPVASQLSAWLVDASPVSRWYLERIIPGAPVFARAIPLASLVAGVALAFGLWTRLAAIVSLCAILSLQLGEGAMFRLSYLGDPGGLLPIGALLAVAIAGQQSSRAPIRRQGTHPR